MVKFFFRISKPLNIASTLIIINSKKSMVDKFPQIIFRQKFLAVFCFIIILCRLGNDYT